MASKLLTLVTGGALALAVCGMAVAQNGTPSSGAGPAADPSSGSQNSMGPNGGTMGTSNPGMATPRGNGTGTNATTGQSQSTKSPNSPDQHAPVGTRSTEPESSGQTR
jgi:hypothetical protein